MLDWQSAESAPARTRAWCWGRIDFAGLPGLSKLRGVAPSWIGCAPIARQAARIEGNARPRSRCSRATRPQAARPRRGVARPRLPPARPPPIVAQSPLRHNAPDRSPPHRPERSAPPLARTTPMRKPAAPMPVSRRAARPSASTSSAKIGAVAERNLVLTTIAKGSRAAGMTMADVVRINAFVSDLAYLKPIHGKPAHTCACHDTATRPDGLNIRPASAGGLQVKSSARKDIDKRQADAEDAQADARRNRLLPSPQPDLAARAAETCRAASAGPASATIRRPPF